MKFSSKALRCQQSPMRKFHPYAVAAAAAGKKIYHLNIGQPDIQTPKQLFDAVRNFHEPTLAYAPSPGIPALIDAICSYYARIGVTLDAGNVLVTTGGSEALQIACNCILDDGDEIIVPEPFYPNYHTFITTAGASIHPLHTKPEEGYFFADRAKIEACITSKTKAIMITNPGNPTGTCLTRDEMKMILDVAVEHDLYLIADEVYREFAYETGELLSFLQFGYGYENLILIDSVSKRFSACGARIGCLISRNVEFMAQALKYCQARLSVATLDQVAAAALYSNQPNVTRMIRKLESELGCALFFRSPQGVRLTPEGEKLYTHIAVAFESIEAGEEEVLSDQSLQSGIVHIAASSLALRTRLLQVLARYRRAYPHVRICLTNHSASHGLAAVQNGLADFAILAEGASVPDSLTAQKIDEIQEIPICGPAFLELTEEPVSLKRLADYPIISLTEGTSSHDFYAELFLRHGLSFSPDVEVETTAQVPPVVQSDLGVGFVPREMLYGTPEASGIYPIMLEEPIPARSVFLFQRKTQPLSIAAKKLRQMLLEDAPQESGK